MRNYVTKFEGEFEIVTCQGEDASGVVRTMEKIYCATYCASIKGRFGHQGRFGHLVLWVSE